MQTPKNSTSPVRIETVSTAEFSALLTPLASLLHDCVHAGASIGFVLPFQHQDAADWWHGSVGPALGDGTRLMLVAYANNQLAGTVQLDTATMPNQRHKADVMKLMVHPQSRRLGIARALMAELETHARAMNRTLLTLDTRSGDDAEPLYTSLGYETVGPIPGYATDPFDTAKRDATTIMYKNLS